MYLHDVAMDWMRMLRSEESSSFAVDMMNVASVWNSSSVGSTVNACAC